MNKWINIAVVVILVLAAGFFFSRRESAPTDDASTPPVSQPEVTVATAPESTSTNLDGADCPEPTTSGSGANHAGLLVTFGDGTSSSVCVAFDGDSINGFELLEASGLSFVHEEFGGSLGQAVCKITDGSQSDGCDFPSENCFCDSPPNSWGFFVPDSGQTAWVSSQTGISSTPVADGGVQAQAWGDGSSTPPSCFYKEICG